MRANFLIHALAAALSAILLIKPALAEPLPDSLARLLQRAVERDIAEQTSRYLETAIVLIVDSDPSQAALAIGRAKALAPARSGEIDQIVATNFPGPQDKLIVAQSGQSAEAKPAGESDKKKRKKSPLGRRFENGDLKPGSFFSFSGWDGEVELGGKLNTGNTDQQSIDASFEVYRENATWRHDLRAEFDWTNTNDDTTRQRLNTDYQIDYYLSRQSYTYGLAAYEDDRFSGFDYRLLVSAGVGYRLLDGETYFLDFEAGLTGRRSRVADTGVQEGEIGGRLNAVLEWALTDRIVFENQASALIMDKSTTINTSTGIKFGITNSLSGRIKFDYEHNSEVPVGRKKSSTKTRVTVIYDF